MKILFVSSGNSREGISPIVKRQGESLAQTGMEVDYFTIKGKGYKSYFRHIFILRNHLKSTHYDKVHAHYSFSAFVASFAGARQLVVSLMGSDLKAKRGYKYVILFLSFLFRWKHIIVKSDDMKRELRSGKIMVMPNGVNLHLFRPLDKNKCREELSWDPEKTHVLFAANPNRPEKNFELAKKSVEKLNDPALALHALENVAPDRVPVWMNASDVVILSSLWEGSPNVVKEALACNCLIVTTDVGDVRWLIGEEPGCFIASQNPEDFSAKIRSAILYSSGGGRRAGRERLLSLGLDSASVAQKIITLYKD